LGHSQADKAQSRERIIQAAAKQIRRGGLDSLSIADLMKQAQLTNGAFYGHFPSRAALIAAALERAIDESEMTYWKVGPSPESGAVEAMIGRYLSAAHRDSLDGGCAVAALGGDVARSDAEEVREITAHRMNTALAAMTEAMGGGPEAENASLAAWSTMIGAVILARVYQGSPKADEVLKQARSAVLGIEAKARTALKAGGH
jgi:TetR/AcrR family transcriptional repressor of nem operon